MFPNIYFIAHLFFLYFIVLYNLNIYSPVFLASDFAQDFLTYTNPDSSLTGPEASAIILYTHEFHVKSSLYSVLNKVLRENKDRKELEPFKKYIWTFTNGLKKCKPFKGEFPVRIY